MGWSTVLDKMTVYRLPGGGTTTDSNIHAHEWKSFGDRLEKILGIPVYGYDPGIQFVVKDGNCTIPVSICQRILDAMDNDGVEPEVQNALANCQVKHTKYQPTTAEFCCPQCKAEAVDFPKVGLPECFDCPALHASDYLLCTKCDYTESGSRFVHRIVKQKNLVTCKHCKGTGLVKGET